MAIPLMRGAARARKSYNQMLRLVLTGQLIGSQDERGRWTVDEASLERFISEEARLHATGNAVKQNGS